MILHKILLIGFVYFLGTKYGYTQKVEKPISDFSLMDTKRKIIALSNYPDAKGFIVVFTCNHCPFAKLYTQRLKNLNKKYLPLGVPLLAISSTDTISYEEDTFEKMVEKSIMEKYNFPYLYDSTQEIAKLFSAKKTPHAFVIWKNRDKWSIEYSGAIDDNGAQPDKVNNNYVSNAVNALLSNKDVEVKETKSVGCQIYFRNIPFQHKTE